MSIENGHCLTSDDLFMFSCPRTLKTMMGYYAKALLVILLQGNSQCDSYYLSIANQNSTIIRHSSLSCAR